MIKKITEEQINVVLQAVYQTNIPVAQFDALRKLLQELPVIEVKEEVKEEK